MAPKKRKLQFILLPVRGLHALPSPETLQSFFVSLSAAPQAPEVARLGLRVVDSIREDGAKLVEMPADAASAIRRYHPGARLAPVRYYRTARSPRHSVQEAPRKAATAAPIVLRIVSGRDGSPVPGATVVAFVDFANRVGASAVTNRAGEASLSLGAAHLVLERVYVYPVLGFWSALRKGFDAKTGAEIALAPVDLSSPDVVRHFYGNAADASGAGITVGVVDTGIGPHPDLAVDGGLNTVVGEDSSDIADNGAFHGTHVAGIIAARGMPPAGVRGLAPAVRLRSYRVFGKKAETASNYSIAKAVDAAVRDGCDLVNMSLGGGEPDEVLRAAVEDARAAGSLVIAAAGNGGRGPVSFPASDSLAIAVSAFGRKGTFPAGASEAGEVAGPYGTDRKNFVAAFTNIGPEIDLTGPGVGVVSTVPGGFAVMSGTSMACPAVTGRAGVLLAGRADLLAMARDERRSDAMVQALLASAGALGFGALFEGQGMVR